MSTLHFRSQARSFVRHVVLALGGGCALAGAVHAQTVVEVEQVLPIPVTQVVVGGDDGRLYRMVMLQPLESEEVDVTAGMVWGAQPFSVQEDSMRPITSWEQLDAVIPLQTLAPISTGKKAVHSFYTSTVYEVHYRQGGARWVVETAQPPQDGRWVLSAEMQPRRLPL